MLTDEQLYERYFRGERRAAEQLVDMKGTMKWQTIQRSNGMRRKLN